MISILIFTLVSASTLAQEEFEVNSEEKEGLVNDDDLSREINPNLKEPIGPSVELPDFNSIFDENAIDDSAATESDENASSAQSNSVSGTPNQPIHCTQADSLNAAPIANWSFAIRNSSVGGIEGGIMPIGRLVRVEKVLVFDENCRVLAANVQTMAQNVPLSQFAHLFTITRTKFGSGESITVPGTEAQSLATGEPGSYRFTASFNSPDATVFGVGSISTTVIVAEPEDAFNRADGDVLQDFSQFYSRDAFGRATDDVTQCSQKDFQQRAPISNWNFPVASVVRLGQLGSVMPLGNLVQLNDVFRYSHECQVQTANATVINRQVPLNQFGQLFTITRQKIDPGSGRVLESKTVRGSSAQSLIPTEQGVYKFTAKFNSQDDALFPLPEISQLITVVDPRNDRKGDIVTTRIHVGGLTGSGLSFQANASTVSGASFSTSPVTSSACAVKQLTAIAKRGRVRSESSVALFVEPVGEQIIPDALWVLTRKGSNEIITKRRGPKFSVAPRLLGDGDFDLFLKVPDHYQSPGVQNFKLDLTRIIPIFVRGCGKPAPAGDSRGAGIIAQNTAAFDNKDKDKSDQEDDDDRTADEILAEIAAEEAAYDAAGGGEDNEDQEQAEPDEFNPLLGNLEEGDQIEVAPGELVAQLRGEIEKEPKFSEELIEHCKELLDEIQRMKRILANDLNCNVTKQSLIDLSGVGTKFSALQASIDTGIQKFIELQDEYNTAANAGYADLDALQGAYDYLRAIAEKQQIIKGTRYTPRPSLGAYSTYLSLIARADDQDEAIEELTELQNNILPAFEKKVQEIEDAIGNDLQDQSGLVNEFIDELGIISEQDKATLESEGDYYHPIKEVNDLLIEMLSSPDGETSSLLDDLADQRNYMLENFKDGKFEHCLGPPPGEFGEGEVYTQIPGLERYIDADSLKQDWINNGLIIDKAIADFRSGEETIINPNISERATVPERLEFERTAYQPLDKELDILRQAIGEAEYAYFEHVGGFKTFKTTFDATANSVVGLLELYKLPGVLRDAITKELEKAVAKDPELAAFLEKNPSYEIIVRGQIVGELMEKLGKIMVSKLADFLEADLIIERSKLNVAYGLLDNELISGHGNKVDTSYKARFAVEVLTNGAEALGYLKNQANAMKNHQEIGAFLVAEALVEVTTGVWIVKAFRQLKKYKDFNIIGKKIVNVDGLLDAMRVAKDSPGGASLGSHLTAIGFQAKDAGLLREFIEALGPIGRKALGLPPQGSVDALVGIMTRQLRNLEGGLINDIKNTLGTPVDELLGGKGKNKSDGSQGDGSTKSTTDPEQGTKRPQDTGDAVKDGVDVSQDQKVGSVSSRDDLINRSEDLIKRQREANDAAGGKGDGQADGQVDGQVDRPIDDQIDGQVNGRPKDPDQRDAPDKDVDDAGDGVDGDKARANEADEGDINARDEDGQQKAQENEPKQGRADQNQTNRQPTQDPANNRANRQTDQNTRAKNDAADDSGGKVAKDEPGDAPNEKPDGAGKGEKFDTEKLDDTITTQDVINIDEDGNRVGNTANVYFADRDGNIGAFADEPEFVAKTYNDSDSGITHEEFFADQKSAADRFVEKDIDHVEMAGTAKVKEVQPDGTVVEKDVLIQPAIVTDPKAGIGFGDQLKKAYGGKWPKSHQAAYVELFKDTVIKGEFPLDGNAGNVVFYHRADGRLAAKWGEYGSFIPTDVLQARARNSDLGDGLVDFIGTDLQDQQGLIKYANNLLSDASPSNINLQFGSAGLTDADLRYGFTPGAAALLDDDVLGAFASGNNKFLDNAISNEKELIDNALQSGGNTGTPKGDFPVDEDGFPTNSSDSPEAPLDEFQFPEDPDFNFPIDSDFNSGGILNTPEKSVPGSTPEPDPIPDFTPIRLYEWRLAV